jgi:catalase
MFHDMGLTAAHSSAHERFEVDGEGAHDDHRVDDDHWEQPGNLFRKMTKAQQQLLFENTARAMGDARAHIMQRHVENVSAARRWGCQPSIYVEL